LDVGSGSEETDGRTLVTRFRRKKTMLYNLNS
jgi:hypothetical protein